MRLSVYKIVEVKAKLLFVLAAHRSVEMVSSVLQHCGRALGFVQLLYRQVSVHCLSWEGVLDTSELSFQFENSVILLVLYSLK